MRLLQHGKRIANSIAQSSVKSHCVFLNYIPSTYQGLLSNEELEERGWDIQPLKILKADIPVYIESDEDLQLIKNKIQLTEDKIEILENIIKTLNNRGYLIKNAIEWSKFQNGL